jgi:hypothetical protein
MKHRYAAYDRIIQTDLIQTERAVYRVGQRTTYTEAEVYIQAPDKIYTVTSL